MSEQEKQAAAQEGKERLMSFAMGIGRLCKEAGISYEDLAKAASVDPDKLAPALVMLVKQASEEVEKKGE